MNEITMFLVGLAVTILVTTAALRYLQPHMKTILIELCGTEERARFWTSFSNVTLFLTPLIFALRIQPESGTLATLIYAMSDQISLALLGLVLAIGIVGIIIGRFIRLRRDDTASTGQTPERAGLQQGR
ncbi:MAG TPA: hypothetical protein VGR72_10340 [Candidatus Acidoferrales bacterium]|nr:hypothetical protein [Candidatus Acidoferrales bacterium]